MSCTWVFWLQILAHLTVTQLSLHAYQEMLVCQPGATHLPLEPIREGKASSPNLRDACSDVSSLCVMLPPSAAGRQSSRNESDQLEVFVWDGRLLTGPSQATEGGQQPPWSPLLLPSSHRHLCPGSWASALCSCAARLGRDGGVRPPDQGARHPAAILTAESQGGRRPHLGKISHLRFSAMTSAQRKE